MTAEPKPPIDPVRWRPPPVEDLPSFPAPPLTVVPLPGNAPEDVVVDAAGNIWTGVEDGRIIRIDPDGSSHRVVADTEGRPLGLAVARDGRLLICDSHRGLLTMDTGTGELETLVDKVDGRRLKFCSNVVETSDGTLFFTESTSALPYEYYKGAALEGRPRGSLFRRDTDGTVLTVVAGLHFANGVTLTADGSAVVFAESLGRRLSKYWLSGPQAGSVTPLVTNLPGYPDNISTGSDGRIWTAMVAPVNALAEWLTPRAPIVRRLLWKLPYRLLPDMKPEVWAVAFDPDTGAATAGLHTSRPDFALATGAIESDGRLWLGCIGSPAVAYAELDGAGPAAVGP
ncbi:MAG: gluconolactonase [Mycobacterium sp.]|jgi:sugar lactone lactonase YvrE|nr:gluconolactonase [Mycobacterium sp.]